MPAHFPAYEFTVSPRFLLRIAGLSAEDVEPLASPKSASWADRVLGMEQQLVDTHGELAVAIGVAVGRTEDKDLRRDLLAVRRDVHNMRLPKKDQIKSARRWLESGVLGQLDSWLAFREEYERVLTEGSRVVDDELATARSHLREIGRDQRMRTGIQLGTPMLERALDSYLEAPAGGRLSKRHRGVERSLVNYVFRAAFKTSPFGSFTRLCLGEFVDGCEALSFDIDSASFQDCATVNLAALGSIAQSAMLSDDLRGVLPVTLTPCWVVDGDRIRYVRRQYSYHSAPTAPTAGILEEADFSVPRGQILDEVIDIVGREPGITIDDLTDRLHEGDPAGRPRDQLAAYTDRLLELGLLITPNLRVDPGSADPAGDFADRMSRVRSRRTADVCHDIDRMADCARRYESAGVTRRGELLAEAKRSVHEAQRKAGRAGPDECRTVFYADSVSTAVAGADRAWWQAELLPQLERLSTILPVFDPLVLDGVMLKGYFRDQHGRGGTCDDITRFAHNAQRKCSNWTESYARSGLTEVDTENAPFAQRDLTALRDARRLFAAELRGQCGTRTEEVVLDDQLLDRVRERLTGVQPGLLPASFFLQLAKRDGGWLCALNLACTGLGASLGRFGYPLEDATSHRISALLRRNAVELQPDSAVFAEITGGYDASNLSWHPPIAPYQIVGPAEISFRQSEEQLPLDDLMLVDDPDADELRLHSRRLGVRVVPVYLGSLVPVALPEVQRTLLALSCSTMPNMNLAGWLTSNGSGDVEAVPRVRYGDIVLHRRSWSVRPTSFPSFDQDRAEWLLEWRRWWREHQMPARMFYSVPAGGGGLQAHLAEKPRYVSIDSVLSLMSFTHSIRSAHGPVRMTEMFPQPDESLLADQNRYTSEICIEITGVRKGTP